jgi:hypothetical protein
MSIINIYFYLVYIMACELYTQKGYPCPRKAAVYNNKIKKVVCNSHNNMCKNKYTEYKKICKEIWNQKCLSDTSDTDIKNYIKFADMCMIQRMDFTNNCCNNTTDRRHEGAILKMNNIIGKCNKELNNRTNK